MSEIKSSAVVKYSADKSPVHYCELAHNTNLNCPPAKWLLGRFGMKRPWSLGHLGNEKFGSFSMANSYIDYIGKVDVITDAENIKSLLKLPYTNSSVSMIVHRIGRSLLLDSFDVYRQVLLTQEEDWKWIRQFILNVSEAYQMRQTSTANKAAPTRKDIEEKLMLSKFLYYSVQDEKPEYMSNSGSACLNPAETDPILPSSSPDPLYSEDDAAFTNKYERNILWNFEDIRMLVGTDLPIFGGGTHPCVTLRLKDMKKPINILTGIDYWLDQLMSNVPEVVMCYHINGIVQKYEVIKTEDIPNLPDGRFNPELIRDVAQNILSFLKQNATKEGHTYWLFKGPDDDAVKLYDLTSVCKEYIDDSNANPFTVPVAVLMYRVAKNLLDKTKSKPRKIANTIYRLLHHCLDLLDIKLLPQVVGSIHYLLSNLYLMCGDTAAGGSSGTEKPLEETGDAAAPTGESVVDFDSVDFDFCDSSFLPPAATSLGGVADHCSCVSMDLLTKTPARKGLNDGDGDQTTSRRKFIPNVTNLEDCCKAALEHVHEGLVCSQTTADAFGDGRRWNPDEKQVTSDPNKAIPLRYEPLKATADCRTKILPLVVRDPSFTPWQIQLTSLLMLKAVSAYYLLADCSSKLHCYGKTLRYVKLSLSCFECVNRNLGGQIKHSRVLQQCRGSTASLLPSILMLCGDTQLMLSHEMRAAMARHRKDYETKVYRDERIVAEAAKLLPQETPSEYDWCAEISDSVDRSLNLSVRCYEAAKNWIAADRALKSGDEQRCSRSGTSAEGSTGNAPPTQDSDASTMVDEVMLSKRLGNVMNELAVYYMNQSSVLLEMMKKSKEDDMPVVEKFWNLSYNTFQQGIRIFHDIDDKDNEALLNSNCGKLFRLSAEAFCVSNREFSIVERHYLEMAVEQYQRATELTSVVSADQGVWESVVWELCSTYFTLASHLQERPPISCYSATEIEKDITCFMHKALRTIEELCKAKSHRLPVYAYRRAVIYHRLGSLYHKLYRENASKDGTNSSKSKNWKNLAEMNYDKSASGYLELISDAYADLIRVNLERTFLLEFSANNMASLSLRLKNYEKAFRCLLTCKAALREMENVEAACHQQTNGDCREKESHDKRRQASKRETAISDWQYGELVDDDDVSSLTKSLLQRMQLLCKSILKICRSQKGSGGEITVKDRRPSERSHEELWKKIYALTLRPSVVGAKLTSASVLDAMEAVESLFK